MNHYITFPEIGLKFPISDVCLQFNLFGSTFTIKWYGVMIALGFLLACIYSFNKAKKLSVDTDKMLDVVLVSTLLGFIGARLYYVLFSSSRSEYFSDPISILKVWEGGLGIYGGILFAFGSGIIMCKIKKIEIMKMFDIASFGFLIGQCIGRWGNFFNQEAFGGNTSLPWGMSGDIIQSGIHGAGYNTTLPVHPTFLYESLWCLLGFILFHFLSVKAYSFTGKFFSLYLIWYGLGRFCIESLRTDSLMLGIFKVSQIVAILAIAAGVTLFILRKKQSKETIPQENEEI